MLSWKSSKVLSLFNCTEMFFRMELVESISYWYSIRAKFSSTRIWLSRRAFSVQFCLSPASAIKSFSYSIVSRAWSYFASSFKYSLSLSLNWLSNWSLRQLSSKMSFCILSKSGINLCFSIFSSRRFSYRSSTCYIRWMFWVRVSKLCKCWNCLWVSSFIWMKLFTVPVSLSVTLICEL